MCVELFINACKPLYQGPGFLSAALLYVTLLTAAAMCRVIERTGYEINYTINVHHV